MCRPGSHPVITYSIPHATTAMTAAATRTFVKTIARRRPSIPFRRRRSNTTNNAPLPSAAIEVASASPRKPIAHDQRDAEKDVAGDRGDAHGDRRLTLPQRVEGRRDDARGRIADQPDGVEPQRRSRRLRVGRQ